MTLKKDYIFIRQGSQRKGTEAKYHDAILACSKRENLHVSISKIAQEYRVNPAGLCNQLRAHYPAILDWRFNEQIVKGMNTFRQQGHMNKSEEDYKEAVELYRRSELNVREVARVCQISHSGFRQHLLFYHNDLVKQKQKTRYRNQGQQIKGKRNGNNTLHSPRRATIIKFAGALKLYTFTELTVREICNKEQVSYEGFCNYLRTWHRELMLKRKGIKGIKDPKKVNIGSYKHYLISAKAKYSEPIKLLKNSDLAISAVAKRFSMNPETFRTYLKEHEPELVASRGMMRTKGGKLISKKSYDKYFYGIQAAKCTDSDFKDIAKRYGLTYSSFYTFVRRNFPELIRKNQRI